MTTSKVLPFVIARLGVVPCMVIAEMVSLQDRVLSAPVTVTLPTEVSPARTRVPLSTHGNEPRIATATQFGMFGIPLRQLSAETRPN